MHARHHRAGVPGQTLNVRPRWSRWVFIPVLAVLASLLSTAPAAAIPPANDDIANAMTVTGAGFTDSKNTSDATYAANDGDCGAATVWYTFTPATSGRYAFDTVGSGYDTTLAVFVGAPSSLRMIDCRDDDVGSNERIVLPAVAGTTYYVQAGTCCGPGSVGQVGPGGTLAFHVSVAPPAVNVRATVNRRGTVNRFGAAFVRGTLVCNRSVEAAEVSLRIRQPQRSRVVSAYGFKTMRCSATPRSWTVVLENDNRSFKPRAAHVRLNAFACDDFTCDDLELQRIVRLRARR
jgi:hypothetical protein